MSSSMRLLFLSFIFFISKAISFSTIQQYNCSSNHGNYTTNSTYMANLNHILSSFPLNTQIDNGFYSKSYGEGPNKVYAIGFCRGDIRPEMCRGCLSDSRLGFEIYCPNQKEAIAWYDNCMLRYSHRDIIGVMEDTPFYVELNSFEASNKDEFGKVVWTLMNRLRSEIFASKEISRKFATSNISYSSVQTVFGLVQCTPDLSRNDCHNCLSGALADIFQQLNGSQRQGAIVVRPSCWLRYEVYNFYDNGVVLSSSDVHLLSSDNCTARKGIQCNKSLVTATVMQTAISAIIVFWVCFYKKLRRRNSASETLPAEYWEIEFDHIKRATDNFSIDNEIGTGGFGNVYKARSSGGQYVAVKRLSIHSKQGDREFKNEVELVAKLQHRNLVKLLGFCSKGNERLLVFEFVEQGNLAQFIFDPIKRSELDAKSRYKIIIGIARGLLYLHEDSRLRIIHRDLKASNILLDSEMNPKISDFGMAKLFSLDETHEESSRIVGTYGYMAPEYALRGHCSVRSDVFSFGVLILEIVAGKRNGSTRDRQYVDHLLTHAWKCWMEGNAAEVIDPMLRKDSKKYMTRCIHIGLLCVQDNEKDRPSMSTVLFMLNSYSPKLIEPSKPAYFMGGDMTETEKMTNKSGVFQLQSTRLVPDTTIQIPLTDVHPR